MASLGMDSRTRRSFNVRQAAVRKDVTGENDDNLSHSGDAFVWLSTYRKNKGYLNTPSLVEEMFVANAPNI